MTFTIHRHRLVSADLERITFYIADYAGFEVAEAKTYEIENAIRRLQDFPHIGTVRDEVASGLRVVTSVEKAVICFTVDNEARMVRILSVTYAGQDWQRITQGRK